MTRPLTHCMPTFVIPIADQYRTRSRAFGVLILILDALMIYAMYYAMKETPGGVSTKTTVIFGAIAAAIGGWAFLRFKGGARAARVCLRAMDENAKFVFDTKRVGELGPQGAILTEVSVPITAEQFTHLLSMPRPQVQFQAPLPPARINR